MSDSHSGGFSREEAEANITPGKILNLNICFPHQDTPEDKYLVVVGNDNVPLLLKINSENRFTQRNRRLRERQFRIRVEHYPSFLDYDSYLDCGTVWYILS